GFSLEPRTPITSHRPISSRVKEYPTNAKRAPEMRPLLLDSYRPLCLDFDRLNLNCDLDLIPNGHAASFQQLIPDQSEISPVDLATGAESNALATPGILGLTFEAHIERNRPRHSADREIS